MSSSTQTPQWLFLLLVCARCFIGACDSLQAISSWPQLCWRPPHSCRLQLLSYSVAPVLSPNGGSLSVSLPLPFFSRSFIDIFITEPYPVNAPQPPPSFFLSYLKMFPPKYSPLLYILQSEASSSKYYTVLPNPWFLSVVLTPQRHWIGGLGCSAVAEHLSMCVVGWVRMSLKASGIRTLAPELVVLLGEV